MSHRIRNRLTYTNVVATLALFLALGGISYAAVAVKKNSVGTKQLKKSSVTGAKVKNRSLAAADLMAETHGPTGAVGSQGPIGPTGVQGPPTDASTLTVLGGAASLTNANQFISISGKSSPASDETLVTSLSPTVPITARNLSVQLDTAPGIGNSRAFTVRINNLITNSLGCSISGAATTCDAAGPLLIPPGTRLSIGSVAAAGPADSEMRFGLTVESP